MFTMLYHHCRKKSFIRGTASVKTLVRHLQCLQLQRTTISTANLEVSAVNEFRTKITDISKDKIVFHNFF